MPFATTKFEVSDPARYDSLISDQKKKVRKDANNAAKWLELGRLQEAKVEMTKCFAEKSLLISWLPVMTYAVFFITIGGLFFFPSPFFQSLSWTVTLPPLVLMISILTYMTCVRYPRSGSRYFSKALSIDPDCADAYIYLGRIALRRHQKKRACFFLEQALSKGGDKKLNKALKNIYEKEFTAYFIKKSEKEKELQNSIAPLLDEIKILKTEVAALKNQNAAVTKKSRNAGLQAGRAMKQIKNDMTDRVDKIRLDYEKQIADLEQAMEAEEEQKETARKNFSALTLEIMEANAANEIQSFEQSAKAVEDIMGPNIWQQLCVQTKSCLATAEHAFSMLGKNSKDTDFSLVGMELCKALETEINEVLVGPFAKTMNECDEEFLRVNKTGEMKGKPTYFTYLAKVVDDIHYPEVTGLSLGQYLFVLKKTLDGEYAMDEYGNFLEDLTGATGFVLGRTFLRKLKTVTNEYRNSIVHHAHINIEQCEHLRALIFNEKNSLLAECGRIAGNLQNQDKGGEKNGGRKNNGSSSKGHG